jgi:TPR repeat protein
MATWYLTGRGYKRSLRKAVSLLRIAARAGSPDAQYDLAVCFERGEGVKINLRKAIGLYLSAALGGDRQSLYEVGRCFYYGIGVARDRNVASIWFDRARQFGVKA